MTDAKTPTPAPAPDARIDMSALASITHELELAEQDAQGWRERRNAEILRLRRQTPSPTIQAIAAVAHVQHGYVSRIVRDGGYPASGSAGA